MIPTTSATVNVSDLHPTLKLRVDAMLADTRMAGYRVVSGVRSYELQKSLYSGWRKRLAGVPGYRHYNNAANPDAAGAATFDGLRFRGSYHMVQDDGYGHAVDLRAPFSHSLSHRWSLVGKVGREYGLHQTVASEWWHLQARNAHGWFPAPRIAHVAPPRDVPLESEEDDEMSRIPVSLAYDEKAKKMRAFVVGEGSTLVDEPKHWIDAIEQARATGLALSSPHLQALIDKCRRRDS